MFHHRSRFNISFGVVIGRRSADTPMTMSRLKMFDPTILPSEMSLFPVRPAVMETAVSGALVPIATIVRPITMEGTRRIQAMEEEPSTKKSAPLSRRRKPTSSNKYIIMTSSLRSKKETLTARKIVQ